MGSQLSISGIYDLYNAGVAADQSRTAFVVVHIYVDTYAERDMVLAVRDALLPETPNSEVRVRALYDRRDIRGPRPDVGIIIAGSGDDALNGIVKTLGFCLAALVDQCTEVDD